LLKLLNGWYAAPVSELICPKEFLSLIKGSSANLVSIDVRSEVEFEKGQLPGSVNCPILRKEHREQVGLTFKKLGQEEAIRLGHQLVDPLRRDLVEGWKTSFKNQAVDQSVLFCWRGGLRSKISQQWLKEAGLPVLRVEGGYKAIRNLLLDQIDTYNHRPLVLSGMTGSGKTELLHELSTEFVLDLEELALHRGSAFGPRPHLLQPSQQTFENKLGLRLWGVNGALILEDESRLIGKCALPNRMVQLMSTASCVLLKESLEQRSIRVYREYVEAAVRDYGTSEKVFEVYQGHLARIRARLGGLLYDQIRQQMSEAFQGEMTEYSRHQNWIENLLANYYDRLYSFSFHKINRIVAYEGDRKSCHEYLTTYINRRRT